MSIYVLVICSEMRRFLRFAAAGLLFAACTGINQDDGITDEYFDTLSRIYGRYSLVEARWGQEVDISGNGFSSNEIRFQLWKYGWHGAQTLTFHDTRKTFNILDASYLMLPTETGAYAQVNLFIPYFRYSQGPFNSNYEYEPAPPEPVEKRCCIQMESYQFHYAVDDDGQISVSASDSPTFGNTFGMKNVSVSFGDGRLYFSADTRLYDFRTEEFKDGRMEVTFIKADSNPR